MEGKKQLILYVLDILRRHSDEDHKLGQQDIKKLLKVDYGIEADRKTIKRNLDALIDFGYDIDCATERRRYIDPRTGVEEESSVTTDYFFRPEFEDSELRLLIASVMFSRYIPASQCKDLVGKLEGLSSKYFHAGTRYISVVNDTSAQNRDLFLTIDTLDEAISSGRKVCFGYSDFGTDLKLHPRLTQDGQIKRYIVSPYRMVAMNGRYYLISNTGIYDNVSHYRLDRIRDIEILEEPIRPENEIPGLEQGLYLPKHLAEHLNMYIGDPVRASFRFRKSIINDVIDCFGTDLLLSDETDGYVTASVYVNEQALIMWAEQRLDTVRVLSPDSLVAKLREDLSRGLAAYWEN